MVASIATGPLNVLVPVISCSVLVVIIFDGVLEALATSAVVANVTLEPDSTLGILIVPPELDCLRLEITGVVSVLFVNVASELLDTMISLSFRVGSNKPWSPSLNST